MKAALARAFRGAAAPLLSYYAISVVVPLLNGAGARGMPFLEHVCFVLLVPPVLIVITGLKASPKGGPR
jgi:hypothetical protein